MTNEETPSGYVGKRIVDVGLGLLLLLATLPVLVAAALTSAVALRAWPFFVQDRVGAGGQRFRFVKIRTLPRSVDPYADKFQLDLDALPAAVRFLRRFHLDELPQLGLLVIGRMSLVGPRPEMPTLHGRLPREFAAARTSVRPGCTGLWQISEAVHGLIGDDERYDRFYLEHRTLRLDAWILWRTVAVMLLNGARIHLGDVPGWAGGPPPAAVIDLRDAASVAGPVVLDPAPAAAQGTSAAV